MIFLPLFLPCGGSRGAPSRTKKPGGITFDVARLYNGVTYAKIP